MSDENEIQIHHDYLFYFALSRVGNETAAQDLVQETFLAAIQSRDGFKNKSCLRTWLGGIMRHKIADHFRQSAREVLLLSCRIPADAEIGALNCAVPQPVEVQDPRYSPSRQMETVEFWQALDSSLGKLPSRMAQVFQLYEIEGETGASVCAQLQISPQNLWVVLHRARKKLCEDLRSWWCESI
jgi:RNA polymerase sigma-70 factor (ECF subfamily)